MRLKRGPLHAQEIRAPGQEHEEVQDPGRVDAKGGGRSVLLSEVFQDLQVYHSGVNFTNILRPFFSYKSVSSGISPTYFL
jgi:hypothetical protein